ncbi:16S rRNA methyltransferase [Leptospira gomenensis]|uniref:16S rRNA methyltransferase n=1 Tax=Leptospira gomenensis TaxID=2484974 RepID=A0A5F1YLN8_9LEPT|nr:SAM-dependent methyltransferase [Leptospira gomenensis]TGK33725.1 16S rRNA methyltransferase [Leptospira gomenensis]TGK41968.1 16S rRNA methyltransferase [Leptospira gomenensis]TGK44210.1 16S rRNA methyltransferase [Leptospira gomenensis]TGK57998.1 16S rRNA methyltransferase [Leptospira gomenensis]
MIGNEAGTLTLVSVSLGNPGDITDRAKTLLRNCELLIGEESRIVSTLLKSFSIERDFSLCNEHSSSEDVVELAEEILKRNGSVLISDAGTPGIEDPGRELVLEVLKRGGTVKSAPGPIAFGAALSISGFRISPFTFCGFLSRDPFERKKELTRYMKQGHTFVFYETPYRYKAVLHDLRSVFSDMREERSVFFCLDLTMESEFQFRGKLEELIRVAETLPKGNPVVVVSHKSETTFSKNKTSLSKSESNRKADRNPKNSEYPKRPKHNSPSKSGSKKFRNFDKK